MAWLNLSDWRTAKRHRNQRQRLIAVVLLSLFSLLNITAVVDPLYSQFTLHNLDVVHSRVTQWQTAQQNQLSAATRYQQDSSAIQQQVNQVSQILTLELSNLMGLNIDRVHWTSSQLSLSGTYHSPAELTQLSERLRHDGAQSVQLQLKAHNHAQLDVYRP